jgi:hypothetical protein
MLLITNKYFQDSDTERGKTKMCDRIFELINTQMWWHFVPMVDVFVHQYCLAPVRLDFYLQFR